MAVAGMAVAQERGFAVPERLSITGFDDTELAAYTHPALTTVRTNAFAWGQAAARVLLDLVAGDAGRGHRTRPRGAGRSRLHGPSTRLTNHA